MTTIDVVRLPKIERQYWPFFRTLAEYIDPESQLPGVDDPRMRAAEITDVIEALVRNGGRTFRDRDQADGMMFGGLGGGGFGIPIWMREMALALLQPAEALGPDVPDSIPRAVVRNLGVYVYALVDPRTGTAFYVGKGKGNSVFKHVWRALKSADSHGSSSGDHAPARPLSPKRRQIQEIYADGFGVEHWVIRHGIKNGASADAQAYASVQNLVAFAGLTEVKLCTRGRRNATLDDGPYRVEDLIALYSN